MAPTDTVATTPNPTSDPAVAGQQLAQLIHDHREALAKGPDLPPALAEGLIQAGLTQLWLPHALGGPETAPLEFIQTIEALAKLDGAVAWSALISSIASRSAGQAGVEPMRRLLPFGKMLAFSGSGHPTGTITRDGDGWRINGRWTLASFSRYSTITVLVCIEQENGAPRVDANGGPVLTALARTKVPFVSTAPLCEQEHVQLEVAWAKTRLLAARAFAFEAVSALWASVSEGQPAPVEQQALVRMACCNAGDIGKEVVGRMYELAGSTALLEEAPFAAQLRDINAACQQINFANRLMVPPGRILLGLDPGTARF
jgi:alkylation response protein AidB-like acyl-CoA dehydrogenase